MSYRQLSSNQHKILEILKQQPELTARAIASLVFGTVVKYQSKEYSSVHRSLRSLEKRGLVERKGGQLTWRRKTQ